MKAPKFFAVQVDEGPESNVYLRTQPNPTTQRSTIS
jgi:hypothetical protein